ncbi:hypothetical protein ACTWQB_01975 [Piscibacillus sp. B03]|uniref:hypothetical protein n=1 Tax=Piscibacillus sp. B03 TaxID=3457430 RepID=UPI003FCE33A4
MTTKPLEQVNEILEQAESIKERFRQSEENAKQQAEKLKEELQELQAEQKEIYSMFVLDEVEASAFNDSREKVEAKQKELQTVQSKINNISDMMQYELEKLYNKYEQTVKQDFNTEKHQARKDSKQKVMEAKHKFLSEIVEIAKDDFEFYKAERHITDLQIEAGLKKGRNYNDFIPPYILWFSHEEGSEQDIGNGELFNTYKRRKMNPSFEVNYNKMKKEE